MSNVFSLEIKGQLKVYQTTDQIAGNTKRAVLNLTSNPEFDIRFFAGLLVIIQWKGVPERVDRIDTMYGALKRYLAANFKAYDMAFSIVYAERK